MPNIELVTLTKGEVHSLSGHDRGLAAREMFELGRLDSAPEPVTVRAPDNLDALSPSFVQGLFADSVHSLGRERFYTHYKFDVAAHLRTDIDLGVNRVLMQRKIAGT